MKMTFRHIIIILLWILILIPFSLGNSPRRIYYEYNINGSLERPNGKNKENFVIALYIKTQYGGGFTRFYEIEPNSRNINYIFDLTDTTGRFSVAISSYIHADSLALVVLSPDHPITFGLPFSVNESQAIPNYDAYTANDEAGCSGCGTGPITKHEITSYSYHYENKIIMIDY
jgi:hypothetical protein